MQQSATDGFIAFHRFGLVERHRGRQYFGEEFLERDDQIPNILKNLNVVTPPPGEPQTSIDLKFSPDFIFSFQKPFIFLQKPFFLSNGQVALLILSKKLSRVLPMGHHFLINF